MLKIPFEIPTYEIRRASRPPALDGWIENPCWRGAKWIDAFISVETGVATDKPTSTALLWDEGHLYVGLKCTEPCLAHIQANAIQTRDVWNDDAVEIYLNPGLPDIESVDTAVNYVGKACPALRIISDPGWGTYQFQETGGIKTAVRYTGRGWQAEVAIPFGENHLPFPKPGDTWRGNICRNDRLGCTWSFWAIGHAPGYTHSDGKLFPYLRFSDTVGDAAPSPVPKIAWKRTPRFALRGMMYDTSRGSLIYKPDYWIKKMRLLRGFGYNTVIMYFENHLRYRSHPEFAPEGSWTVNDLVAVQDAAAKQGIDVIPAQASLGHCSGILTHPKYKHLAEKGSNSYQFCPAHPETHQVLVGIFDELAAASRSPYVSINADESAYLGLCPRCREKFAGWSKGRIFREHILKLYAVIRSHGKRMMMWDDMLWLYPDALDDLPRDIIQLDWHYNFHCSYPSVEVWRAIGFDVVVCPGMYMVENAFRLADYGAARGAVGLINTLWEDHSLPLGSRWPHLLATSWAAHAKSPSDIEAWYANAGSYLFGPGGARLGRSLAGQDLARRNGYPRRGAAPTPPELHAARQVRDESEALLAKTTVKGEPRALLEESAYAHRLLYLQSEVAYLKEHRLLTDAARADIASRAASLSTEGLARWQNQCTVPSQRPSFLERFTAIEAVLQTK